MTNDKLTSFLGPQEVSCELKQKRRWPVRLTAVRSNAASRPKMWLSTRTELTTPISKWTPLNTDCCVKLNSVKPSHVTHRYAEPLRAHRCLTRPLDPLTLSFCSLQTDTESEAETDFEQTSGPVAPPQVVQQPRNTKLQAGSDATFQVTNSSRCVNSKSSDRCLLD